MGYDTSYSLEVKFGLDGDLAPVPDSMKHRLVEKLCHECEEADYALDILGGSANSDARWYKHEDDMRKFSAAHPDFVFILKGEGQESDDVWAKYFKAGKCQEAKAEIKIPDYDPAKLK